MFTLTIRPPSARLAKCLEVPHQNRGPVALVGRQRMQKACKSKTCRFTPLIRHTEMAETCRTRWNTDLQKLRFAPAICHLRPVEVEEDRLTEMWRLRRGGWMWMVFETVESRFQGHPFESGGFSDVSGRVPFQGATEIQPL